MNDLGKKIDELSNQLTQLRIELWTKHTGFTWQWWMLVGVCVISIVAFIFLVDKKKLLQSLAYFGIVFIINKYVDSVATHLDWYDYRIQLEPIIPTMVPANLFAVPVGLSIIYQRYEKWKHFVITILLFSILVSYVALPLMKSADIYLLKTWNSHLSLVSLSMIAFISKLVIDWAETIQRKNNIDKSH